MNFLIVGLGASLGAILRNELTLLQSKIKIDFPVITLLINILGALLLGIFTAQIHNGALLLLLGTGFCGGFTIFGTFEHGIKSIVVSTPFRTLFPLFHFDLYLWYPRICHWNSSFFLR